RISFLLSTTGINSKEYLLYIYYIYIYYISTIYIFTIHYIVKNGIYRRFYLQKLRNSIHFKTKNVVVTTSLSKKAIPIKCSRKSKLICDLITKARSTLAIFNRATKIERITSNV